MRDGWWLQEHLALMADLASEADVANRLVAALSDAGGADAAALRRSLAAQAAQARELLAWLDLLTPGVPTVAWVTGPPSADTDSFVAQLVDGSAIRADADPGTHSVKVGGYRSAGSIVRAMADGASARVTLAEYVEQYQRIGTGLGPVRFVDRPLWPVDQVLLVETPLSALSCVAQYSLRAPAVVFFLSGAATPDEEWMRTLRAHLPTAAVHVVATRAAVADILWQLAMQREAGEQRALAQRVGRHMVQRRRARDRLAVWAGPGLPGRLLEEFSRLDMHLLPASR